MGYYCNYGFEMIVMYVVGLKEVFEVIVFFNDEQIGNVIEIEGAADAIECACELIRNHHAEKH